MIIRRSSGSDGRRYGDSKCVCVCVQTAPSGQTLGYHRVVG